MTIYSGLFFLKRKIIKLICSCPENCFLLERQTLIQIWRIHFLRITLLGRILYVNNARCHKTILQEIQNFNVLSLKFLCSRVSFRNKWRLVLCLWVDLFINVYAFFYIKSQPSGINLQLFCSDVEKMNVNTIRWLKLHHNFVFLK